jgi:hypothetical protein
VQAVQDNIKYKNKNMEISNLISKLNEKLPSCFTAKVGGSMVLKALELVDRCPEDVDIIISTCLYSPKKEEFKEVYDIIQSLFPLEYLHEISITDYVGNDMPITEKEKYAYNLKIYGVNMWAFGQRVSTINFMVQKDFVSEDHYSSLMFDNVPCVSLKSILKAKKSYGRFKDLQDFNNIIKILI